MRLELARGALDPGDVALYVFLASGLSVPLFYFEAIDDESISSLFASLGAVLAQLVVSAVGVWRCYLANGGRSGSHFAETFIAIGWVVGVRMLLVLLLPFIALMFLKAPYLESAWVETFMIGLYAVYLWRICTHIHWVRARRIGAA